MSRRFRSTRKVALAVLTSGTSFTTNAGRFLGELVANDPRRLTANQLSWLGKLLSKAGLPPMRDWNGK